MAEQEFTPEDHVNVLQQFLARASLTGAEAPAFTQALGWLSSVPAALEQGEQATAQLAEVRQARHDEELVAGPVVE